MRKGDINLKEDPSIFFISKWIIIVGIMIITAISFTLGYFVGKNIHAPVAVEKSSFPMSMQQESFEPKPVSITEKESLSEQPATQQIQPSRETSKNKESPTKQQTQKTIEKLKTQQKQETKQNNKASKTTNPTKKSPARKYTVQVGAFKNISDANTLKEKLEKKGYNIYVIYSEAKQDGSLYKVMIGKFNTRKEAEILSLKLKKSEKLQSFVTFNPEEEHLR
ncbi:MAG: SPOR domain-containing protein [Nitrospirota bacterium]